MRIEIISDASVFVERAHAVQLKSLHVSPPKLAPAEGEAATGLACIVDIFANGEARKRSSRVKLCASADAMSSSEAEIAAGLLGLAFVSTSFDEAFTVKPEEKLQLEWRCDNEGVVNSVLSQVEKDSLGKESASGSEIKQHFFQLLSAIEAPRKLEFTASQLASALKEPRQRNCDRVSRWLRTDSEVLYKKFPNGGLGRIASKDAELAWQRVEFPLQKIRESEIQLSDWRQVFGELVARLSESTKNA